MKILVTGAAGFIGSHLAERLKKDGHEVLGLDAFTDYYNPEIKRVNQKDLEKQGIKVLELDLAEDDLTNAVEGVEVIYHLAAQPGISELVSFDDYVRNNITATFRLVEAIKDSSTLKMFVNCATSSVYGLHADDTEETPPKPASYYGVTKLAAEQLVLSYHRNKGMPACSIRPFSVYGPRERPEKLYPKYLRSMFEDDYEVPYREGSENHLRSYTYIDDIIDGFVAIIDHMEDANGEVFNIGIDSAATTGEALKVMDGIASEKAKIKRVPAVGTDQLKTEANIDKARRILNYNPTTPLEVGLKKEYEWFKEKIANKIDLGEVGQ